MLVEVNNTTSWGPPAGPPPQKPAMKQKCECCPYGYHIDLDFVRYCEAFNSKTSSPSSKLRERRRQRQSMEVLLGITSPTMWQLEQQVPQVEEEEDRSVVDFYEPPAILESAASASACRDALNKAVLDFEETLQRTHKRPEDRHFESCQLEAPLIIDRQPAARLDRTPSSESIFSSLSGEEQLANFRPSHDSDVASIGSAASGVSTCALQLVREQMARSLEKMREMEESVKLIPILQSQVSVLKEEKRLILLQVKAGEAEKNKMVSQMKEDRLPKPIPSSHSDLTNGSTKISSRDIGVECSVLTRDVGVSHQGPKIRTASTQVSMELPAVPQKVPTPEVKPKVRVHDRAVNTDQARLRNTDSSTDLSMQQIFTDKEVETMMEKQGEKIKRDDEAARAKLRVEKSVSAKPRCTDAHALAVVKTRDIGVSEHSVADVICDKCSVRKKSVGVGGLATSPGENLTLASLTMSRSKSSDHFNLRPKLRPMAAKETDTSDLLSFRDKGVATQRVSTADRAIGTQKVDTREQSVLVLIEPSVVERVVEKESKCAACEARKLEPPKTLMLSPAEPPQSLRLSPSPTPQSRIPRLAAGNKSPVSPVSPAGKRPFHRQDTYTKLQPQPVPEEDSDDSSSGEAADEDAASKLEQPSSSSALMPEETPLYTVALQARPRKRVQPSQEMRGAMKVMSDSLKRSPRSEVPAQLKNAVGIIQQEWFKMSSTSKANPLDVEDYLDCFEDVSNELLEHIVNMSDNSGNTAMHYAVSHGNFDVVSILLDSKVCNINQANQAGYTSVMLVSLADVRSETDAQVVQRLFQLSDVNIRAKQHGQTALMLAASHGKFAMASMLLAAGADVNVQDEDGSTSLMCAAEHGHVDMVKLLLSQPDMDANIADHDGSTALNIAMEAGHRDVGVLLYAHQHFNSRSSSRTNSPFSTLKRRAK